MLLKPEETGGLLCQVVQQEFGTVENYARYSPEKVGEAEVSIFWNDFAMWVVFRGTEPTSLADWYRNLRAIPVTWPGVTGKYHAGYKTAVQNVGIQVMRFVHNRIGSRVLYIAGHSAGGGMAQAFAAWVADMFPSYIPRVAGLYTYGSPRCTTAAGRDRLVEAYGEERLHRYALIGDRVPKTPPALFGYRHVGRGTTLVPTGAREIVRRFPKVGRMIAAFTPTKVLGTHAASEYVSSLLE